MRFLDVLLLNSALISNVLASDPQVTIDYGIFRGFNNASTGSDNFLGIPFATAGRLENPVLMGSGQALSGVQDATK
jgi:hypothetical protein